MPYIKQEDRKKFDYYIDTMPILSNKGELEYCIYKLMKHYMINREYRYSVLHDAVYAAQHCSHEFERRYLDKREDQAIAENGDI